MNRARHAWSSVIGFFSKRLSVLFVACVLFAGMTAVYYLDSTRYIPTLSADEQTEYWRERIRTRGADVAHDTFARFAERIESGQQHGYAHIFGRALYREVGLDGAGVCDERFHFGCIHEFFGHAIAEYGLEILPSIAEACFKNIEKHHPCQHGMGHGILASLGYHDISLLHQALSVCNSVYTDDPINGCMGGVFMEFNLYESLGSDARPRDAASEGWYSPCSDLSEEYQKSCSWWLPQWWYEYMRIVEEPRVSEDERFRRMGVLCRELELTEYIRDCFQQVGQLTIWSADFRALAAKRLCDVSTEAPHEKLLCRAYAAYMFTYYGSSESEALMLCDGLQPDERSFCETYARREAYTPNDIPLPSEDS